MSNWQISDRCESHIIDDEYYLIQCNSPELARMVLHALNAHPLLVEACEALLPEVAIYPSLDRQCRAALVAAGEKMG